MKIVGSALKSSAAFAIVVCLLANAAINVICVQSDLPFLDVWLLQNAAAFSEICHPKQNWSVLLLGSSVMESPFSHFDGSKSIYTPVPEILQTAISQASAKKLTVRNFCVTAALVSDQFILLKKYILRRNYKPTLVLGLVPRDFYDSRLCIPSETSTFKVLVTPIDVEIWPPYIESPEKAFSFLSNHLSLLFRFRRIINWLLSQTVKLQILDKYLGLPQSSVQKYSGKSAGNAKQNEEEVDSKDAAVNRLKMSYADYLKIYDKISRGKTYQRQLRFLDQFVEECQANKVPLLLVNMPLTSVNKSLLPTGFYDEFCVDLQKIASQHGVKYLDTPSLGIFKDTEDFWDTAHLNARGGRKLTKLICPLIIEMSTGR